MRWMRGVLWFLLAASLFGFVYSFIAESAIAAKAQKVQIVRIDLTAKNPFGPVTKDVGDPKTILLDDSNAFLKNRTPMGLPMVDSDYLKQHNMAVVRLSDVLSVINFARMGCVAAIIISIVGLMLVKRMSLLPISPD